jgi:hypothetical protein
VGEGGKRKGEPRRRKGTKPMTVLAELLNPHCLRINGKGTADFAGQPSVVSVISWNENEINPSINKERKKRPIVRSYTSNNSF